MPGEHTAKQKRQAKHIVESAQERGLSKSAAERIAWATVNKQKAAKSKGKGKTKKK
jgi:hypothetical protein